MEETTHFLNMCITKRSILLHVLIYTHTTMLSLCIHTVVSRILGFQWYISGDL